MEEILTNPFTPVVGKAPFYMAGREEIIRDMESVLSGDENNPAVILLFEGARGTAKTALLSRFAEMVESDGWIA